MMERVGPLDCLVPEFYPQWAPGVGREGRYHARALAALRTVRGCEGWEPRAFVLPNPLNATIAAHGKFSERITVLPGTVFVGFSGSSHEADGFTVQIADLTHGTRWFSGPQSWKNCTVPVTATRQSPLYLLPAPRVVDEMGLFSIEFENLSANANQVQFVLWGAEYAPYRDQVL